MIALHYLEPEPAPLDAVGERLANEIEARLRSSGGWPS